MRRREFLKAGLSAVLAGPLVLEGLATGADSEAASLADGAGGVPYFGKFLEVSPANVNPGGWLKEMLRRQTEGLAKHHAASGFPYDSCLWAGKIPDGGTGDIWPYEQSGYLVDGLTRLGWATGDAAVLEEAQKNIRFIVDHPQPDGSLGLYVAGSNWPHAVVFRALLAEYAAKAEPAILDAIHKHYLARPAEFGHGRDVANVEEILRVYRATGDPKMLDLAKRSYVTFNSDDPPTAIKKLADNEMLNEHGVTFNETSKIPAILYSYTDDTEMLDAAVNAYRKVDRDHMMADGLHTCQEYFAGSDPSLYHETCDVTDYTYSLGYLLMATGDATWADHIEKAVFNAGLGSITKDFRAHQYFSSPNQPVAAHGFDLYYDRDRAAYRPGHVVQCCSGNVHRFLPNYALRQWMVTPGGGVVAALFGASTYSAEMGGAQMTIEQETDYPFSDTIEFVFRASKPVTMPFYVRIPGWTNQATLAINGKPHPGLCSPGTFETIARTFADGDRVTLTVPMSLKMRYWGDRAASLERGPLVFSLKLEEESKPVFGHNTTPDFPAFDKRPLSKWNYGLRLNPATLADEVSVNKRNVKGCPWDTGNSPIELYLGGMTISNWELPKDKNPTLPTDPRPGGSEEGITFVPYGSTCIRMTVLPLLG